MITGLRQVAQHAPDLDASVAFYRDVLGAALLGRVVPPGIALLDLGGVRLLLEPSAPSALLYLDVDDLEAATIRITGHDIPLVAEPHLVHRDTEGLFGPAGEEEWMTFLRDPADNLLALVERREPGSPPGTSARTRR